MKKLLIAGLISLTTLFACSSTTPTIESVVVSALSLSITSGTSQLVVADVTGTGAFNKNVNWTSTIAGVLAKTTGNTNTFTAPVVTTSTEVTLTATSIVDSSKKDSLKLTINPIPVVSTVETVTVTTNTNTLAAASSANLSATVTGTNNPSNDVTWSIASGIGTLSAVTGSSVTFTAPSLNVASTTIIRATSVQDPSKNGIVIINTNAVVPNSSVTSVTVQAITLNLNAAGTTLVTATVAGTGGFGTSVMWSIVSGQGSLDAVTGSSVTFTAPSLNVASTTIIRATSVQDPSKSGTVTINIADSSIQNFGMMQISAGHWHTCGLTASGTAYCWGDNFNGQLGNNSLISSSIPVAVVAPAGGNTLTFSSISAGFLHTCGLTSIGIAYCWGANHGGHLGNGTYIDSSIPVAVVAPSGGSPLTFSSISAGVLHTCGLTLSGAAYCWGNNSNGGRLGDGTITGSYIPVAVAAPLGGSTLTFSSISASNTHTCGLTSTGAAYCWGSNVEGQLGVNGIPYSLVPIAVVAPSGDTPLTFQSISAGYPHTCGVTLSGAAYCWGRNLEMQLGNNTNINSSIPVAVVAPSGGSPLTFSSISAGVLHTCGVTSSGAAYCWGSNGKGQLGNPTTSISSIPVVVVAPSGGSTLTFSSIKTGGGHTCGVTSNGAAYCWGMNVQGQLGNGNTTNAKIPVVVVAP